MKKNKFLMFAASAVMFASCGGGGGRPQFGDNEYPVVTVGTSSASMQSSFPATIKGVQDVQICPKVQGFIRQINVKCQELTDQRLYASDRSYGNHSTDNKGLSRSTRAA